MNIPLFRYAARRKVRTFIRPKKEVSPSSNDFINFHNFGQLFQVLAFLQWASEYIFCDRQRITMHTWIIELRNETGE